MARRCTIEPSEPLPPRLKMTRLRTCYYALLALAGFAASANQAVAWGPEGHRVVGLLAETQFTPGAREKLLAILGSNDREAVAEWCNWPDRWRDTAEGAWSAPLHYINVPRHAAAFEPGRDCGGGHCSAGALRRYAGELGDADLPGAQRRRAWGWVCHLAGDIHQPMHNGFGEDRGGNDFPVVFRGRSTNLHAFWDHDLIRSSYTDWRLLPGDLAHLLTPPDKLGWQPGDAYAWIVESHELLRDFGYPPSAEITPEFTAERWLLAREQLALAASRLAALVNEVLE